MRVWEETWRDEPMPDSRAHRLVNADHVATGISSLALIVDIDGHAEGRARLAACAPEMARMLAAVLEFGPEWKDTKAARELLRKAGVIA